ncbi:hypothetical protein BDC45DRAFT_580882 [Circinella umbellata]|nr:hypothetical protein BDC45DRAFT_580882 [Circinella umbellata]
MNPAFGAPYLLRNNKQKVAVSQAVISSQALWPETFEGRIKADKRVLCLIRIADNVRLSKYGYPHGKNTFRTKTGKIYNQYDDVNNNNVPNYDDGYGEDYNDEDEYADVDGLLPEQFDAHEDEEHGVNSDEEIRPAIDIEFDGAIVDDNEGMYIESNEKKWME